MVVSSSPNDGGGGVVDGGNAALLSAMQVKHEMHREHMTAGITIDSAIILKITKPLFPADQKS